MKKGAEVLTLSSVPIDQDHVEALTPVADSEVIIALLQDCFPKVKTNAFTTLDAGNDPHYREYVADHPAFEEIRSPSHTAVFAEPGGGKSALRVRLADACRVGENGTHYFPLVYQIPDSVASASPETQATAHEVALIQVAASELLLRFTYRPDEFLQLTLDRQQAICQMLKQSLGASLTTHLNYLEENPDLEEFVPNYDPTARWPKSPSSEEVGSFVTTMRKALDDLPENTEDEVTFQAWVTTIKALGYSDLFVLVDGVDAHPETADPAGTAAMLEPLLKNVASWQDQVWLKMFLPSAVKEPITQPLSQIEFAVEEVEVEWTDEQLIKLIGRRFEQMIKSAPASLQMLADPNIRNLDRRIVRAVRKIPRDVIMFVNRLFHECAIRTKNMDYRRINDTDFKATETWYKNQPKAE